jgi:hypothetical protein
MTMRSLSIVLIVAGLLSACSLFAPTPKFPPARQVASLDLQKTPGDPARIAAFLDAVEALRGWQPMLYARPTQRYNPAYLSDASGKRLCEMDIGDSWVFSTCAGPNLAVVSVTREQAQSLTELLEAARR